MVEMERLAGQLPSGFDFAWTGQSLQEKLSGSQAIYLPRWRYSASFLCLAALYESWSIPLAVLLVVPTGVVGAVFAMMLRDMPNDVYFKVGLITVNGLTPRTPSSSSRWRRTSWCGAGLCTRRLWRHASYAFDPSL